MVIVMLDTRIKYMRFISVVENNRFNCVLTGFILIPIVKNHKGDNYLQTVKLWLSLCIKFQCQIPNSLQQSPSWESYVCSFNLEFLCLLRNPKLHYRFCTIPSPVRVLRLMNPVHILTSNCFKLWPSHLHPVLPSGPFSSASPTKKFPYIIFFMPIKSIAGRAVA